MKSSAGLLRWAVARGALMVVFFAAMAVLAPSGLGAQVVSGVVTSGADGQPVRGAFITLLDGTGTEVENSLTGPDGVFSFRAPSEGEFTLRVEHIAFEAHEGTRITAREEEPARVAVQLETAVLALEGFEVTVSDDGCAVDPNSSELLRVMWSRAQQVLRIMSWADEGNRFSYELVGFTRDVNSGGDRIEAETGSRIYGWGTQPFVTVADPGSLERGFVSGRRGQRVFTAPDAALLLSDSFLDRYCLTPGGETPDAQYIGIRFQPRDRRAPGAIDGVVWFDVESMSPAYFSFAYINVDYGEASGAATGRIDLGTLESGLWYVKSWTIRTPRIGIQNWDGGVREVLVGFREDGGQVVQYAEGRDVRLSRRGSGAISGSVVDGRTGDPLTGATVFLASTSVATETSDVGAFSLDGLRAADYRLAVDHPLFQESGVFPRTIDVTVERDAVVDVVFRTPSWREIREHRCRGLEAAPEGAVFGRVLSGEDPGTGVVEAEWTDNQAPFAATVELDRRGRFVLCGLPADASVDLVYVDGEETWTLGVVSSDPRQSGLRTWDVAEDAEMAVSGVSEIVAPTEGRVFGEVLDGRTGEPVSEVEVRLGDEGPATMSDSEGRFDFGLVEAGNYTLHFQHLTYGSVTHSVDVEAGGGVDLAVSLVTEALEVEGVEVAVSVEADRLDIAQRIQGTRFDGLTPAAVDSVRNRSRDMTSLLLAAKIPGISVRPQARPDMSPIVCIQLNRNRSRSRGSACPAMAEVYLNDIRLSDPGAQLVHLDPAQIEWFQFLSPVEAGAKYGTGAGNGVLLLYTR